MQIKCRSKQKSQREAAQFAESRFLGLSVFALPDVLDYTAPGLLVRNKATYLQDEMLVLFHDTGHK